MTEVIGLEIKTEGMLNIKYPAEVDVDQAPEATRQRDIVLGEEIAISKML